MKCPRCNTVMRYDYYCPKCGYDAEENRKSDSYCFPPISDTPSMVFDSFGDSSSSYDCGCSCCD